MCKLARNGDNAAHLRRVASHSSNDAHASSPSSFFTAAISYVETSDMAVIARKQVLHTEIQAKRTMT